MSGIQQPDTPCENKSLSPSLIISPTPGAPNQAPRTHVERMRDAERPRGVTLSPEATSDPRPERFRKTAIVHDPSTENWISQTTIKRKCTVKQKPNPKTVTVNRDPSLKDLTRKNRATREIDSIEKNDMF